MTIHPNPCCWEEYSASRVYFKNAKLGDRYD